MADSKEKELSVKWVCSDESRKRKDPMEDDPWVPCSWDQKVEYQRTPSPRLSFAGFSFDGDIREEEGEKDLDDKHTEGNQRNANEETPHLRPSKLRHFSRHSLGVYSLLPSFSLSSEEESNNLNTNGKLGFPHNISNCLKSPLISPIPNCGRHCNTPLSPNSLLCPHSCTRGSISAHTSPLGTPRSPRLSLSNSDPWSGTYRAQRSSITGIQHTSVDVSELLNSTSSLRPRNNSWSPISTSVKNQSLRWVGESSTRLSKRNNSSDMD